MNRSLPHVVRQAQLRARKEPQLKEFLKESMRMLSTYQDTANKLAWIRSEVDQHLKKSTQNSQCKKGCHYCCYHPITLASIEMEDILKTAPTRNEERLKSQQAHFLHQRQMDYEQRACVFLKDGSCSIYDNRPLICRLTHVTSLPENCHLENTTLPIEHLPVTKAALLVGSFYMIHSDIDLLPCLIKIV